MKKPQVPAQPEPEQPQEPVQSEPQEPQEKEPALLYREVLIPGRSLYPAAPGFTFDTEKRLTQEEALAYALASEGTIFCLSFDLIEEATVEQPTEG